MKNRSSSDDKNNGGNSEVSLGGNIALVGFNILEPAELTIIKKIVGTYVKKLSNQGDYKEMKLTLQQHPHGKTFKHEVMGMAVFGEGMFNSNVTEWNLYTAVSQVCEKILAEVTHKVKKPNHKGPKGDEPNLEGKVRK